MRALLLAPVLLLAGCALAPATVRLEYEHVSHPLAGWPCERQGTTEDVLNQVNAIARYEIRGAYVDLGLGRNLQGQHGGGFYGPVLTGTVRAGYEWRLKP